MSRRPRVPVEQRVARALRTMAPGGVIPSEAPVRRISSTLRPQRVGGVGTPDIPLLSYSAKRWGDGADLTGWARCALKSSTTDLSAMQDSGLWAPGDVAVVWAAGQYSGWTAPDGWTVLQSGRVTADAPGTPLGGLSAAVDYMLAWRRLESDNGWVFGNPTFAGYTPWMDEATPPYDDATWWMAHGTLAFAQVWKNVPAGASMGSTVETVAADWASGCAMAEPDPAWSASAQAVAVMNVGNGWGLPQFATIPASEWWEKHPSFSVLTGGIHYDWLEGFRQMVVAVSGVPLLPPASGAVLHSYWGDDVTAGGSYTHASPPGAWEDAHTVTVSYGFA